MGSRVGIAETGAQEPSPGRGCRWAAVVSLIALSGVITAGIVVFDHVRRDSSFDVCETSQIDLVRDAGRGDTVAVGSGLEAGSANQRDQNANTALGCAIPRHHADTVLALVAGGADVNQSSGAAEYAETPAELAFEATDADTLAVLLDHGADPDRHSPGKDPLLTRAITTKNDVMVTRLLDHGADPDLQGDKAPLSTAVKTGTAAAFAALLAHGADPDGHPDQRPLIDATVADKTDEFHALMAAGAHLDLSTSTDTGTVGEQGLAQAAGNGNLRIVDDLLAAGVDPDAQPYLSPLLRAVTFKHAEVTQRLLDAHADPDVGESDAVTLLWTLSTANPDLAAKLTPPGSTPAGGFDQGTLVTPATGIPELTQLPRVQVPPLAAAIVVRDDATVALLLQHGADPNKVADDSFSPLDLAALACDTTATGHLLRAGADEKRSPAGHDPRTDACPAVKVLLDH